MQEVSSEGGFRQAAIHCSDYSSHDNMVDFSLSRGSFATILLREIMKPSDPMLAGFWDLFKRKFLRSKIVWLMRFMISLQNLSSTLLHKWIKLSHLKLETICSIIILHAMNYSFFINLVPKPTPIMIIPTTMIWIPCVTQSGLEYIKDDFGPTIDCPWRWNTTPKIVIMVPMLSKILLAFMTDLLDLH